MRSSSSSPNNYNNKKKWALTPTTTGLTIALLAASTSYLLLTDPSTPTTLNKERFIPCTVLSRQPVSATSLVLTIRLPPGSSSSTNRAIIREAHAYGLWSVEVKQPQLQIARNYTPLPPAAYDHDDDDDYDDYDDNKEGLLLRFFIRRYETGEVSKYLARLGPGDTVEIRGPHLGFDLGTRLGLVDHGHNNNNNTNNEQKRTEKEQRQRQRQPQERHVVFLAGGTGIAPAMQAARRLLLLPPPPPAGQAQNDNDDSDVLVSSVQILWANRASADCAGCLRVLDSEQQQKQTGLRGTWMLSKLFFFGGPWTRTSSSSSPNSGDESQTRIRRDPGKREHPSLIMTQLNHLQAEYARQGRTLEVECAINEEGGVKSRRFSARDIAEAVTRTVTATNNDNTNSNTSRPLTKSTLAATTTTTTTNTTTTTMTSSTCFYHSQRQLQDSTEDLDAATTTEDGQKRTRRSFGCTCDVDNDDTSDDNGGGTMKTKGKNLFIVSGPERFITSFVGPKVWARGAERQGPVGGVVAQLMRKDPAVWDDWLVLKQ